MNFPLNAIVIKIENPTPNLKLKISQIIYFFKGKFMHNLDLVRKEVLIFLTIRKKIKYISSM